jgi:protein-tyrosine-phosphatase
MVRTVHGLGEPMRGWDFVKFQAYDALDKLALRSSADRVLAVSRRMAETLTASGYKEVGYLHNGIDVGRVRASRARADVRRDLGLDEDAIVIGTAGRFSRVKGHEFLVKAARAIRRREHSARFLFVGSGPLKGELLALAAERGVDAVCLFVDPAVDLRNGVYDLMAAMDVFVLPSLNEGIPMALLEAMALARPVVASAVGGVQEIVTDRITGLLVESRNPDALAGACLELTSNPQRAQTLAARGRRRVEREFSREKQGQALIEAYRDIVQVGVSPPAGPPTLVRSAYHQTVGRLRRKLRYAAELRRVRRQGRRPDTIVAALRSATTLLIVCHGNIIRSAFAAHLLSRALAGRRPPLVIRSAGLEATPGRPAHPTAVQLAGPFGIDLNEHHATLVTPEIVAAADVIFVMDVLQLDLMTRRFPGARGKAFLFAALAASAPLEVADPVLGNDDVFQSCFEHISHAAQPIIRALSDRPQWQ